MPTNVGRYKQGDAKFRAPVDPAQAGTPTKAPLAGPAPKGRQHEKEKPGTVGANRISAH